MCIRDRYHPTIKFTAQYSKNTINFLDVQVTKENGKIVTDLYVKPTDTHQYLEYTSCHSFHCKKAIPYSQALRLNRICSSNELLDKRCNDLEYWCEKRGYSQNLVRGQVLRARKFSRQELLNKAKETKECQLVLNITYHPAFANFKKVLEEIHILLTPDREHRKVFPKVPIVGFKRGKSLKDHLVRAKLPPIEQKFGCNGCGGGRCQVCDFIVKSDTFTDKNETREYEI